MTTKDKCSLLFKDKLNNTDDGQYNNFTFNKNHQISSNAFSGHSKSVITERKVLDYVEKNTTTSRLHTIKIGEKTYNLLDTPGFAENYGKSRNYEIFKEIEAAILQLPEIHGICFVIKASKQEMTNFIDKIITNTLTLFPKKAVQNVFFIFTHAYETNFTWGTGSQKVRHIISNFEKTYDAKIRYSVENICLVDNLGMRWLIAVKNGLTRPPLKENELQLCWNESKKQLVKLINFSSELPGITKDEITQCRLLKEIGIMLQAENILTPEAKKLQHFINTGIFKFTIISKLDNIISTELHVASISLVKLIEGLALIKRAVKNDELKHKIDMLSPYNVVKVNPQVKGVPEQIPTPHIQNPPESALPIIIPEKLLPREEPSIPPQPRPELIYLQPTPRSICTKFEPQFNISTPPPVAPGLPQADYPHYIDESEEDASDQKPRFSQSRKHELLEDIAEGIKVNCEQGDLTKFFVSEIAAIEQAVSASSSDFYNSPDFKDLTQALKVFEYHQKMGNRTKNNIREYLNEQQFIHSQKMNIKVKNELQNQILTDENNDEIYQIKLLSILLWQGWKKNFIFCTTPQHNNLESFKCFNKNMKNNRDVYLMQILKLNNQKKNMCYEFYDHSVDVDVHQIFVLFWNKFQLNKNVKNFILLSDTPLEHLRFTDEIYGENCLQFIEEIRDTEKANDLFHFSKSPNWKKHKLSRFNKEFYNKLKQETGLSMLANEITDAVFRRMGKCVELDLDNYWISCYHEALIRENVIVVIKKIEKSKKIKEVSEFNDFFQYMIKESSGKTNTENFSNFCWPKLFSNCNSYAFTNDFICNEDVNERVKQFHNLLYERWKRKTNENVTEIMKDSVIQFIPKTEVMKDFVNDLVTACCNPKKKINFVKYERMGAEDEDMIEQLFDHLFIRHPEKIEIKLSRNVENCFRSRRSSDSKGKNKVEFKVKKLPLWCNKGILSLIADDIAILLNNKKEKTNFEKRREVMIALAGKVFVCSTEKNIIAFKSSFFEECEKKKCKSAEFLKSDLKLKLGDKFEMLRKLKIPFKSYTFCCEALIDRVNGKNAMRAFCQKLRVVVTPNANALDAIMKNELDSDANILMFNNTPYVLQKKMLQAVLREKNYTPKKAKDYLSQILLNLAMMAKYNYERLQKYSDLTIYETLCESSETFKFLNEYVQKNIVFEDVLFHRFFCDENISSSQIVQTCQKTPILTTIRIKSALLPVLTTDMEHVSSVTDVINVLQLLRKTLKFIFFSSTYIYHKELALLAFECYTDMMIISFESGLITHKFFIEVCKLLRNNKHKKVLFIHCNGCFMEDLYKIADRYSLTHKKQDEEFFTLLSNTSQEKLLSTPIFFQNVEFPLKEWICSEKCYPFLETELLLKIFQASVIEIKTPFAFNIGFVYIPREVELITVDKRLLKETSENNNFIIEGNFETNCHALHIASNSELAAKEFERLCEVLPRSNIHWLKSKGDNLIWQNSKCRASGSYEGLQQYIKRNEEFVNETLFFKEFARHRTSIFAGPSGMGKSKSLVPFSSHRQNVIKWQLLIDLKQNTEFLTYLQVNGFKPGYATEYFTPNDYLDFALQILINKCSTAGSFENRVFRFLLETDKVIFIFDNFDEIDYNHQETFMHICSKIRDTTNCQIWITSGKNKNITRLEEIFQTFAYSFKPFSEEDQYNLVRMLGNSSSKDILGKYANSLSKCLKQYDVTPLSQTPLLMKMLIEMFKACDEKIVNENNGINNLFEKVFEQNMLEDVEKSYHHIINTTKIGAVQVMPKVLSFQKHVHHILGLFALTYENNITSSSILALPTKNERLEIEKWMAEFKNGKESKKFVKKIIDGNIPIIDHSTYAEYFAACYFENKVKENCNLETVFKHIDAILQKQYSVFEYCVKFWLNKLDNESMEYLLSNKVIKNCINTHQLLNTNQTD